MKWCGRPSAARLVGVAAALAFCAVWAAEDPEVDHWFTRHSEAPWHPLVEKWGPMKAAMTAPVENLTLPLDYYDSGRMKAVLRARKAQMFPDNLIFAEGVTVDMLTEDGKPDGRLTADGCLFDRDSKRGYCEGAVGLVKGTDRLKGRGMYFSIEDQFIKILSECEIRTYRIPLKLGRLS